MKKTLFKKSMAWLLALMMVITFMPAMAFAGVGETPEHTKTATDNGDGTTKLEISVTGDADTEVQTAANVNVLIVYDESSSMTSNNVTTNPNRNRADYAEDVVHDFIEALRGYQNQNGNIQVAVVGFGPNATTRQTWTSDLTSGNQGANRFFDDEVDGTVTNSHNYGQNNGTNWQAALTQAQSVLNSLQNNYPTFVVMVTDGAPTAASGQQTIAPSETRPWTDYRYYYNAATSAAYNIQSRENTTLFGIYAYGREADLLDELIYYSNTETHRTINGYSVSNATATQYDFGNSDAVENYYSASNTDALTKAIASIFGKIVEALGVSQVAISDGTTNQVKTSSGEISELLEVDTSSYQYWLSIPVDNNNQFKRVNMETGVEETYTVTDNGEGECTVTWGSNSVTVNGSVKLNNFKYEWTEANALYDKAPPTAHLVTADEAAEDPSKTAGAVDWSLPFVLLNDVTYSVTFDVYPSQATLDIVADIMNDPGEDGAWGDLDPEEQKYIDVNGNLKTNTEAKISYIDTREENPQIHEESFVNPDPVEASAVEMLTVTKKWDNDIDTRVQPPVTLTVTRDGKDTYTVTLGENDVWSDNVYISIGIMGEDGKPLKGSEGHDFTFTEPQNLSYHWEINVPVVHPMLINNVKTMLIKVDDKHPVPSGATTYEFNNATYYVDDSESAINLTATNERRSRLYLTKEVTGEDVPEDAVFPFTLNVVNSLAPEAAPSAEEDPGHDSDWWVWISVRDKDGNKINEGIQGATPSGKDDGYWYAPTNTDITIPAKAGYSIMVNNMASGTTYTITEGDLQNGFSYGKTELKIVGDGTDSTFKGNRITTGTIESTNSKYYVTYTNEYELRDISVNKVWDDADDQDGKRPDDLTLTLNAPDGVDVPEVAVEKNDNTWTYTWEGVPKYDDQGNELTYTVTEDEDNVPKGYTVSYGDENATSASDNGTITNTHTPETIDIPVTKNWDDQDNIYKTRPVEITIRLMKVVEEGTDQVAEELREVDHTTIKDKDGSWAYTFEGKPKNENGKAIAYRIVEDTVANYAATVTGDANGFTVTNTLDNTAILKITKTATGATVPDGAKFTISGTPTVGKFDPVTVTYKDIKNGNYSLIVPVGSYTVTEDQASAKVDGYTLTVSGDNAKAKKLTQGNVETFAIANTYTENYNPPPIHIDPEPVPLDLNGVDHFAYIEGYPDGTVQPEGNITRAEVATMIYRLLTFDRRDEIFTSECNYSDVAAKNWFNKAVASMTAGEYVEGYPDGSFLPNQKITRAEFVTIVVRFLEGERDAENPFTDIDSHWAKKYILSAVDAGWIDGYPDGTFRPQEPIKRDEAMKIMNTILHRGINEESELGEPVMFPDNADPSAWYYYEVIEATNNHDTEGERPDEDWLSNECEYEYDIVKYERPDGAAPAPQDDPEEQTTPDDQDEPAVTDNSIVGQWEYTEEGVDGAFVYTFNEDGTGNYDMAGTVKAFTYTIEGNTLSILYEGDTEPFELPFVVTDTTLTVKDSNDEDVVYNKK